MFDLSLLFIYTGYERVLFILLVFVAPLPENQTGTVETRSFKADSRTLVVSSAELDLTCAHRSSCLSDSVFLM
jgi:hypothetical protein